MDRTATNDTCIGNQGLRGLPRVSPYANSIHTGHNNANYPASMTITQYLGTGAVSRGRMTLDSRLGTIVSTAPYLRDDNDKAAVIKGIENVQATFKNIPNLTWITPKAGVSATTFVNSVSQTSISDAILLMRSADT